MVRVNLTSLTHAKIGYREPLVFDLGPSTVDDLRLAYLKGELQFIRIANGILAEGTLRTEAETECTRCLERFFEPVVFALEGHISLPGAVLTPEHPVRVADDGWADLSPLIREYVWLELPMNPVCTPACQGLCVECGGNLTRGECTCNSVGRIDPRWEALRAALETAEGR